MQFDSTLSLDIVLAMLTIFVAVWRLNRDMDSKMATLRQEQKKDYNRFRDEQRADYIALRDELKTDNSKLPHCARS